jgi:hypothetical protein
LELAEIGSHIVYLSLQMVFYRTLGGFEVLLKRRGWLLDADVDAAGLALPSRIGMNAMGQARGSLASAITANSSIPILGDSKRPHGPFPFIFLFFPLFHLSCLSARNPEG